MYLLLVVTILYIDIFHIYKYIIYITDSILILICSVWTHSRVSVEKFNISEFSFDFSFYCIHRFFFDF